MTNAQIVIIGAGQGGFQAAASLRQEGHTGPITLIGDEPGLPYQRPPLSKAYLKTGEADRLALRPPAFFETQGITYLADTRIDRIDRGGQTVWAGARRFPYDQLILATGTAVWRPPIPGVDRAMPLRSLADARDLRAALPADAPRRVAVIGGGFIGLEFAAVARALGHRVDVVEAAVRLMARAVSPQMSDAFAALHQRLGTELHLGRQVAEVAGDGLRLDNGDKIPADLVLLAAGVRPNVALAEAAGLSVQNGVLVDAQLRSSDPRIFALGDCAAFPDPVRGDRVRIESVQAATDHARLIAKVIVQGEYTPYAAVPWFWSDQAEYKLQIAGLARDDDSALAVSDHVVLRFDAGGRLSAVETINDAKTHMKARRILAGTRPTQDDLRVVDFDLTRV
jgi:3-phenylpropionate/trans-cinnamate dioxygenase ferredoxin reductase subunit